MDKTLFRLKEIKLQDLQEFLALDEPENEVLDYKRDWTDRIIATIAAMANTSGGIILCGVEERQVENKGRKSNHPGGIKGVPPGESTRLASKCHSLLDPPFVPEVLEVSLKDGNSVLVVRVRPEVAPVRPVIKREDNIGKVYVRYHDQSREADPIRLRQLFSETMTKLSQSSLYPLDLGPSSQALKREGVSLLMRVAYRANGQASIWTSDEREVIRLWLKQSPLCQWIDEHFGLQNENFEWRFTRSQVEALSLSYRPAWLTELPPLFAEAELHTSGVAYIDVAFGTSEAMNRFCIRPHRSLFCVNHPWRFAGDARLNWNEAYQLALAGLATVTHSKLLEHFLGPNWSPYLHIYLEAYEANLDQRIGANPSWKRAGIFSPSWQASPAKAPWEEEGLEALNRIVQSFWLRNLLDQGYLGFEADLQKQQPDSVIQQAYSG